MLLCEPAPPGTSLLLFAPTPVQADTRREKNSAHWPQTVNCMLPSYVCRIPIEAEDLRYTVLKVLAATTFAGPMFKHMGVEAYELASLDRRPIGSP